ncbi:hypothetical protein [Sulfurimonas sp.]|uniref:hypothetical protein n=1 Tax=Sulfurimonas sp. TaxID=2022749 RepID=UPI0035628BC1
MLNKVVIDDTLSKDDNIASILKLAQSVCDQVIEHKQEDFSPTYVFDYSKPAHELGLEEELIAQLIEDYIYQVFNSYENFHKILDNVSTSDEQDLDEHLIELKNLAHKNLGVARNLRIEDSQILLTELMNNHTDIEYLKKCVEALMGCSFKLNPGYAYDVLKLKKIKDNF